MLMVLAIAAVLDTPDVIEVSKPVSVGSTPSLPYFGADASGATVVWAEDNKERTERCIVAVRIDRALKPSAPAKLSCKPVKQDTRFYPIAFGSGRDASLVLVQDGEELVGQLVTPSLALKPGFRTKVPEDGSSYRVDWDGTQFWIASLRVTGTLDITRVSAAGKADPTKTLRAPQGNPIGQAQWWFTCRPGACVALASEAADRDLDMHYVVTTKGATISAMSELPQGIPPWPTLVPHIHTTDGELFPGRRMHVGGGVLLPGRWSIEDLDVAHASTGTLVHTSTSVYQTNQRSELQFVTASTKGARHEPLILDKLAVAGIAPFPGDRFVMLTKPPGGAPMAIHTITVKHALLDKVPAPRPPLATGSVADAAGAPATTATIGYELADGTVATVPAKPDGSFVIPHPRPRDHRPTAEIALAAAWAVQGAQLSPRVAPAPTLALRLAQPATLRGTVKRAKGDKRPVSVTLQVLRMGATPHTWGVVYEKRLSANDAFDFGDVPAGTAWVSAIDPHGDGRFAIVELSPGKAAQLSLVVARPGTLRFNSDLADPEYAFVADTEMSGHLEDEANTKEDTFTIRDILPGPHKFLFKTNDGWTMTREITIPPDKIKDVTLKPVADLPPGHTGIRLLRAGKRVLIDSIAPGSPAAGKLTDGEVVAIDGTAPRDIADASARLLGKPGSTVIVRVRKDAGGESNVTLTRTK